MKKIIYLLTKYFTKVVFLPFLRIDYQQISNLAGFGPRIFTANHPSTLDPIFIMSILKTTVSILITQSAFCIPLIGFILKKTGHIPVVEDQGQLAYQQAKDKLVNGQSVLIFPEGRLSHPDGTTQPFYSGAVRLAMETNIPIIPLGVSIQTNKIKTKRMTIKDRVEYARFYLRGKYGLTIGNPLKFSGNILNKNKLQKNKNKLAEAINQLIKQSQTRLVRHHSV